METGAEAVEGSLWVKGSVRGGGGVGGQRQKDRKRLSRPVLRNPRVVIRCTSAGNGLIRRSVVVEPATSYG